MGTSAAGRGLVEVLDKVSRHPDSCVGVFIFALLSAGPARCAGVNFFLELFAATDGVSV
jgi:hypothetical protein